MKKLSIADQLTQKYNNIHAAEDRPRHPGCKP